MLLAKLIGTDYSTYFAKVRVELATIFKKYDSKFGAVSADFYTTTIFWVRRKQLAIRFLHLMVLLLQVH